MYRQMARQSPIPQIYCFREDCRDSACGKFHANPLLQRRNNNVRNLVGAIEAIAIETNTAKGQKAISKLKERPQLMVQTQSDPESSKEPMGELHLSLSPQSLNSLPNGASLSLALPPHSPATSQGSGISTSVTLEDIIASARRKISEEYQEIRLPSPEFEEGDSTLWDKRAARKQLLFHESSLDIPAADYGTGDGSIRFLNQYEDQESEAELAIHEEPPSFIGEDDDTEDFEEMLKASQPPLDAFSNPILLRDADPLTVQRHRKRRQQKMLNRQQSLSRIQQLGGRVGLSQSSTPSGHTDLGEDNAETSSIDLSMTELSTAVGLGRSPAGSGGPSPSHILKFIEEQKQKGAGTGPTTMLGEGNAEL